MIPSCNETNSKISITLLVHKQRRLFDETKAVKRKQTFVSSSNFAFAAVSLLKNHRKNVHHKIIITHKTEQTQKYARSHTLALARECYFTLLNNFLLHKLLWIFCLLLAAVGLLLHAFAMKNEMKSIEKWKSHSDDENSGDGSDSGSSDDDGDSDSDSDSEYNSIHWSPAMQSNTFTSTRPRHTHRHSHPRQR